MCKLLVRETVSEVELKEMLSNEGENGNEIMFDEFFWNYGKNENLKKKIEVKMKDKIKVKEKVKLILK